MEDWLMRWLNPHMPIYRLEAARGDGWRLPGVNLRRAIPWILLLAMAGICTGGSILLIPLLLAGPAARLWTTVSLSDVIAREVEERTWETLRVILISTERIVKSKYAAGLARARGLFYLTFILRAVPGIFGFCILTLIFASEHPQSSPDAWEDFTFLILLLVYALLEPILDFIIDGALGLLAGVLMSGRGGAMALAFVFGIVHIGGQITLLVFLLLSNIAPMLCFTVLFIVVGLRYVMLRGVLALATWRAERL